MGNEFERLTENGIVIEDNEEEATYGDIVEDTLDDVANDTRCKFLRGRRGHPEELLGFIRFLHVASCKSVIYMSCKYFFELIVRLYSVQTLLRTCLISLCHLDTEISFYYSHFHSTSRSLQISKFLLKMLVFMEAIIVK